MATWQFDILFLSRSEVESVLINRPKETWDHLLGSSDWWRNKPPYAEIEKEVSLFLRENESWSPEVRIWGEESGNVLKIVLERGVIAEISVRVDVRKINYSFLVNIVNFARKLDCLLLTQNSNLIEPGVKTVLREIEESHSFKFVLDPQEFLRKLNAPNNS